jgi:hypothetical protein
MNPSTVNHLDCRICKQSTRSRCCCKYSAHEAVKGHVSPYLNAESEQKHATPPPQRESVSNIELFSDSGTKPRKLNFTLHRRGLLRIWLISPAELRCFVSRACNSLISFLVTDSENLLEGSGYGPSSDAIRFRWNKNRTNPHSRLFFFVKILKIATWFVVLKATSLGWSWVVLFCGNGRIDMCTLLGGR